MAEFSLPANSKISKDGKTAPPVIKPKTASVESKPKNETKNKISKHQLRKTTTTKINTLKKHTKQKL